MVSDLVAKELVEKLNRTGKPSLQEAARAAVEKIGKMSILSKEEVANHTSSTGFYPFGQIALIRDVLKAAISE